MAAPKPHLNLRLNLLYPQGIPQKLPIRFLKWLLSYGRYIVVFVEFIVILTFLARFKLDTDLDNLTKQVNNQVPYVEGLALDETLIKQTQQRLALIKTTYTKQTFWSQTLSKISSQTPQSIHITTINLSPDSNVLNFKITAQTNSNSDLAIFLNGLKNEPKFQNVNLSTISFDQGQLIFSITGIAI